MISPNENDQVSIPEATSRAHTGAFNFKNRSVSLSNSTYYIDGCDNSKVALGYTVPIRTQGRPPGPLYSTLRPESLFPPSIEPPDSSSTVDVRSEDESVVKNANILTSGQLGMCNEPYCTTCPSYYSHQSANFHTSKVSDSRFHTALYDDARGWAKRFASSVRRCVPGIMNPHSKFVQVWTRFLAFSCLMAIFIDPTFVFLLLIRHDNKCIEIDWTKTTVLVSLRSLNRTTKDQRRAETCGRGTAPIGSCCRELSRACFFSRTVASGRGFGLSWTQAEMRLRTLIRQGTSEAELDRSLNRTTKGQRRAETCGRGTAPIGSCCRELSRACFFSRTVASGRGFGLSWTQAELRLRTLITDSERLKLSLIGVELDRSLQAGLQARTI
ncbi:hypothetical protein F2Q69_00038048 [Brassica cretica]|uniref:Uncharacterized protein n=1 Tax=Brassica cretica TaxID=69181 RepID=A0A8S9SIY7_BRACR|nr:hypothetical protein F2Q69_00038048 [Brassica cretica]